MDLGELFGKKSIYEKNAVRSIKKMDELPEMEEELSDGPVDDSIKNFLEKKKKQREVQNVQKKEGAEPKKTVLKVQEQELEVEEEQERPLEGGGETSGAYTQTIEYIVTESSLEKAKLLLENCLQEGYVIKIVGQKVENV